MYFRILPSLCRCSICIKRYHSYKQCRGLTAASKSRKGTGLQTHNAPTARLLYRNSEQSIIDTTATTCNLMLGKTAVVVMEKSPPRSGHAACSVRGGCRGGHCLGRQRAAGWIRPALVCNDIHDHLVSIITSADTLLHAEGVNQLITYQMNTKRWVCITCVTLCKHYIVWLFLFFFFCVGKCLAEWAHTSYFIWCLGNGAI